MISSINKIKSVIKSSKRFIDGLIDPLFITDKDLKIWYINQFALESLGYSREEVIGKMTCADLCKTPLCNTQNCTILNCIKNKQYTVGTTVAKTKYGNMIPIRAQCNTIFDNNGNPIGGFEYIADVTKIDEGFLNNMADAAFRTDKDLIIQNINSAALNALGYTKEEVIGKMTCADLCRTPVCSTANCTIKKAMQEKDTIVATTVAQTKRGEMIPVRASCGYLADNNGNPVGGFEIVSAVNQIDEGFLANMADAAFRTDKDLIIQNINSAALNALGYTKEEVIGKMTCADLCRTPVCNTANCTIKKCMSTKGTVVAETEAVKRNGDKLPIRASCGVLLDQKGIPTGGFEVISDNSALMAMVDSMEDIAKGVLTSDIDEEYKLRDDAVGKLAKSFGQMKDSLNDAMRQVNSAVEQVASGSNQVAQASQSLSQGATEQASSLEEITSSITEISSQAKQNADNAIQASGLSKQAMGNAEGGNSQMKELVTAMGDINKSADEIKRIVKVIDDIAFQTNLLALNANVEAARAGKYGKGFAVVAEEVRNLASRSAESVQETTTMVEEAINNIKSGNNLVEVTSKQLEEIVDSASKTADLVEEISKASREQTQGLDQINQGLGQIDQVTQSNTANAEESASAAEELASQAQQLKAVVARFKFSKAEEKAFFLKDDIPFELMNKIKEEITKARQNGVYQSQKQISAQKKSHIEKLRDLNQEEKKKETKQIKVTHEDHEDIKGVDIKGMHPVVDPKKVIKLDDQDFGKF